LAKNGLGGFGPHERFGAGIVLGEISIDGGLQVGDRVKDAAADALPAGATLRIDLYEPEPKSLA
jgi:hypothetical protein